MRRLVVALAAAAAFLAAGPVTIGPAAQIALAHSQLLSSTPGSGEILTESPAEIRLVFSEPLDPRYSSADVLNGVGQAIVDHGGAPDPADPTVLIVPLPVLAGGAYTVNWRTLSAADGHTSEGFISFGVGSVNPARVGSDTGSTIGGLHGGHDLVTAIIDVEARAVTDLGFLLAFGLLVVALGALRPVLGIRPAVARTQAWSLLGAAAAGLVLGVVSGTAPDLDPAGYLLGTRPGQLLVARAAIGVAGAGVAWWLAAHGRPVPAVALAGLAGAAGIVLIAVGGHASAFPSPAPVIAMTVHLGAAGTWLAGLGTLAALFHTEKDRAWVRPVVSRFSALALVSIALVGATGIFSAWVETGNLLGLDTPYQGNLWIKVALVLAALTIGGVNYLTGGQGDGRAGGMARRVSLEAALAVAVLFATANLAAGSAPSREDATSLEPGAASTARGIELALLPGRPGPNRVIATWDGSGTPVVGAELRLDRLDAAVGESAIELHPVRGSASEFTVDGMVLPAGSAWDATVVLSDASGVEVGRRRFTFALGSSGLARGQSQTLIDPGTVIAALLAIAGLFAIGLALAGGSLPLVERTAGRRALVAGAVVALPLALVLLVWRVLP
jgi:copper transport protein